jgi:hypothetical protein
MLFVRLEVVSSGMRIHSTNMLLFSVPSQLRPVEIYAMRWLEEVEPIVNTRWEVAMMGQNIQQEEWELSQIEANKAKQEAEMDDDEDGLVFEEWDQDAADEVYRQQVAEVARQQEERTQQVRGGPHSAYLEYAVFADGSLITSAQLCTQFLLAGRELTSEETIRAEWHAGGRGRSVHAAYGGGGGARRGAAAGGVRATVWLRRRWVA